MWKKYGSYDVISKYIYILCCSFSILCNNSNCLRQIIKKAQLSPIGEKVGTLSPFFRVLGIFLLNAQLGTGTSYACEMSIFNIQMIILIHFTNPTPHDAAKQRMRKYDPQKSLSNNARSEVESSHLILFPWLTTKVYHFFNMEAKATKLF